MGRALERLRPHLPAALVLLYGGWAGTFPGAATAWGAIAGHVGLLAAAATCGARWRDPLGLGRAGNYLLVALGAAIAASWQASPVPRAGWPGVALLPAMVLVPAAVAAAWGTRAARRRGLFSLALVTAAVAGWSLFAWWRWETPGTSLPLGHHNLLATFLVVLLPLAVVPWRDGGAGRIVATAACVLGVASLAATRSLGAAVAVATVAAGWMLYRTIRGHDADRAGPAGSRERGDADGQVEPGDRNAGSAGLAARRRGRVAVLMAAAAVAAVLLVPRLPRLWDVARGVDPSMTARVAYLEAAGRGFRERPVLGWGPGAASWTLGAHLRPIPGVHPPGQVVSDPHSLPARVLYELGATGALLAVGVAAVFLWRRLGRKSPLAPLFQRGEPEWVVPDKSGRGRSPFGKGGDGGGFSAGGGWKDPVLGTAALAGLAGFALAGLATRVAAAPALPVAALVVAGALLAAERPRRARPSGGSWVPLVAMLAVAILIRPSDLAHRAYDRAVAETDPRTRAALLERALARDPWHPLYQARLAWLTHDPVRAEFAARDAVGLAPLWLMAGILDQESGAERSAAMLTRACRLDPLAAVAPYRLALEQGARPAWAARALLAEPRLLAARELELAFRRPVFAAAVAEILRLDGVEPGWRDALADAYAVTAGRPDRPDRVGSGRRGETDASDASGLDEVEPETHGSDGVARGPTREIGLRVDASDAESFSLHAFRRRPHAAILTRVEVDAAKLAAVDLPPASVLPATAPEVFADPGCGLPERGVP